MESDLRKRKKCNVNFYTKKFEMKWISITFSIIYLDLVDRYLTSNGALKLSAFRIDNYSAFSPKIKEINKLCTNPYHVTNGTSLFFLGKGGKQFLIRVYKNNS